MNFHIDSEKRRGLLWLDEQNNNIIVNKQCVGEPPGGLTTPLRSQRRADVLFVWACSVCVFDFCWLSVCVCVCSSCRYCPDRRVVSSHTPSSIKTTQAVRMNWTSSSMGGNSSSQFCWIPWVTNPPPAQCSFCLAYLESHLANGTNWNLNKAGDNDSMVSHAAMCAPRFLFLH